MIYKFLKKNFGKVIYEKARQLCMDDDKKIRLVMCNEVLEKIVKIIEKDLRPMKILDKINELVYDNDIDVKAAAINLLTRIVGLFPDDVKYNQLT